MSRVASWVVWLASAVAITGCGASPSTPDDAAILVDAGMAPPCEDQLDLLFMIDNSGGIGEEQASFAVELPRLLRALATGDTNEDGVPDIAPIASLHVAVVTSDMGVGGHVVPTCDGGAFGAAFGDDGVMVGRGRTAIAGCLETYPAVFEHMGSDGVDQFAMDVACVANAGTNGCGLDQPLEAVLKAISPAEPQAWTTPGYVPPLFVAGPSGTPTRGHADGANAGFVRPGSILAVVMLTDEEDSSALDPDLYNPRSETYSGTHLNLRAFRFPEALQPVERFVTGLASLRRDPRRLVFSAIVGVPPELSGDREAEYAAMLDHPLMIDVIDSTMPTRLRPSCNVPGRGVSFAPRRIVSVARGLDVLGAETDVSSICQESFAAGMDAIVSSIGRAASVCD